MLVKLQNFMRENSIARKDVEMLLKYAILKKGEIIDIGEEEDIFVDTNGYLVEAVMLESGKTIIGKVDLRDWFGNSILPRDVTTLIYYGDEEYSFGVKETESISTAFGRLSDIRKEALCKIYNNHKDMEESEWEKLLNTK